MSPVKGTSHAVYDLKYHFVWIPRYRKMILREEIAKRVEEVFGEIAEAYEFEIERILKSRSAKVVFKEFTM